MGTSSSRIDHIVYVVRDVGAAIERMEELLGVRATIGGQHPDWGTRNALLSLGPKMYLEIMGPDPGQSMEEKPRPFGIDCLVTPRLSTWAVRTDDIQCVIEEARRQNFDLGELQERSRRKPDGAILRWTMTDLTTDRMDGIVPFFINWGDSVHPAESSPKGCSLISLEAFHPEAARANELLQGLGVDLRVGSGPAGLKATIQTPRGRRVLE